MVMNDDEFLKKLLEAFRIEANEHLTVIANGLVELEQSGPTDDKSELMETMYREAHSLKGAARSVNLLDIETVCQAVESVLSALKKGQISVSVELFDVLHRSASTVESLLGDPDSADIQSLVRELTDAAEGNISSQTHAAPKTQPVPEPEPTAPDASFETSVSDPEPPLSAPEPPESGLTSQPTESGMPEPSREDPLKSEIQSHDPRADRGRHSETIRISVTKLDPLMRQVGEMVAVKLSASQRVDDLAELAGAVGQWKQKWAAVSAEEKGAGKQLQAFGPSIFGGNNGGGSQKLTDFLDWSAGFVNDLEQKIRQLSKTVESEARMHGSMVDDLLEDMMSVLMLPCSSLLDMYPRVVRDLAREKGKEARVIIEGGELEVDRRILDEIKDPLTHLVRNCVDHGIETPEERKSRGKPPHGTITVRITQVTGSQIELTVSDDGSGIDEEKVRKAAYKKGIIQEHAGVSPDQEDAVALVFKSEVSTSPIVTNISGRGLGLAIVREKTETLGGSISVSTTRFTGTTITITLPITLSTFRGVLVRVSDIEFVVPTTNVERVARIPRDSIKTVGNRETIEIDSTAYPLIMLSDVLELPPKMSADRNSSYIQVLMLRSGTAMAAFCVDAIVREQEVLVKSLGKQLTRVRNIAGATVLGTGKLAMILSAPDLIKSAVTRRAPASAVRTATEKVEGGVKSVLIVEDSITSRMLLKNILESSGYEVKTAVDGVEGLTALRSQEYDLVVSDVEMPRMDGFELTKSIRNDDRLSEMPVVLVTSLGSREDRERGIEAGANAYITKGGFDQSNLLEVIGRLT